MRTLLVMPGGPLQLLREPGTTWRSVCRIRDRAGTEFVEGTEDNGPRGGGVARAFRYRTARGRTIIAEGGRQHRNRRTGTNRALHGDSGVGVGPDGYHHHGLSGGP